MTMIWADLILGVHLLGFALVVGGLLAQWGAAEREVTMPIALGTMVSFVSGAGLAIIADPSTGETPDVAKVGVKAAVGLILMVLAWANYRWATIPRGLWWLLLGLAMASAGVGVLWH